MLDNGLSITMVFITIVLSLVTAYYLMMVIKETFAKKRQFNGNGKKGFITLLFSLALVCGIAYCMYRAPYILFNGITWEMIDEFGPTMLIKAVTCLSIVIPLFYLYFILSYFFEKKEDKPFFMIIVLSIVSAIGNSIIIFIINAALTRVLGDQSRRAGIDSGLYLYFLLGIILFTFSAMVVRKRLILITNNVVYEKRSQIIDKVLQAPFDKFEALEDGKVHAALNNDTETVSGFVNAFVNGLTGVITLITCFIYLGTINLWGMVFSVLMIFLAVGLFLGVSEVAEKKFEQNRDIQNVFFRYINDMVKGFKELYINGTKRKEFREDLQKSCEAYRETRIEGEYQFVGVSILGEILYIGVVGIVVFLFPLFFPNLQDNTLRSYVLVYLYMGGIVNQEIYLIPGIMRVMVSWKRINQFIDEITQIGDKLQEPESVKNEDVLEIKLANVTYQYKNESGEKFAVGPINCNFKTGEVTFISGGNGSGKSTLAKLITGLYHPDEGALTVNGDEVDLRTLGNYFSTIFSDFYLFEKMYGVDSIQKAEEIQRYLNVLRINDKVKVSGGMFSTVKLSTGQRKRLALLMSYLEDRPAYLFDEWAADQDPEFRTFFYKVLLPELKSRGKLVIAITHDDRYFNEADKLIKMETGKIVEIKVFDNLGVASA